jgi:hypothetical protein
MSGTSSMQDEMRNAYKTVTEKHERKRDIDRPSCRWNDD